MKNKYYISLIFLFSFFFANAQSNYYYYYKGNRIYLNLDTSFLHISTNNNLSKSTLNIDEIKPFEQKEENVKINGVTNKWAKIDLNSSVSTTKYFQIINQLKNNSNIEVVSPSFTLNGEEIGTSSFLYVKLKREDDFSILQQKANEKHLIIVEQDQFMPLWYTLKATKNTIQSTIEVAAFLYETMLFDEAFPDLLVNDIQIESDNDTYSIQSNSTSCSNDPIVLWGLENVIHPEWDINICNAWSITEGSGIKVAVIDTGIELTHNDLSNNILPLSYDSDTNTSPSVITTSNNYAYHGTHVAGTIGAIKDNNLQVVGVAPQSKLISISNLLNADPNSREKRATAINWAWQNGADIINCSWKSSVPFPSIDAAIDNALTNGRGGLGTVVVFSGGNTSHTRIEYPANCNDDILVVGAMTGNQGKFWHKSCAGNELDVVAPGVSIWSTVLNDNIQMKTGTSMAAPHVSGIAALVLSVNPNLTVQQVNNIIEQSAQKIRTDIYDYTNHSNRPNGIWNNRMGYGLVDAYAAVQLAENMNSPSTLDLYVKDRPDDLGIEPNPTSDNMWSSEDIWIRNTNDGYLTHQNPIYNSNNTPNYIYVRVTNKSGIASSGNETFTINWAKASTALAWPENWFHSMTDNDDGNDDPFDGGGDPLGGELPTVTIPVIQPGGEEILVIPWVVPNPNDYDSNNAPWHFCLLARIDDGNPVTMTPNPNIMVRNENNLAWKNLTIVNTTEDSTIASVLIANPTNNTKTYYLELIKDNKENGKAIYEEAEVSLKMDETLFNAWKRGGEIAQEVIAKQDEKEKLVKGNNVLLDNITFNPNEMGLLTLDFKFLTEQITDKGEFVYHVIQKDAITGEIIGGETFVIHKKPRILFEANAGNNKEVDLNEPITITAEDINEIAEYNWYDSEGNLVYQGKDLTISTDVAKKYKLEVVTPDGFKDYDEVEVKLRPGYIQAISPNPSSTTINIDYKLNGASSAYLMVIGTTNNASNNYILNNLEESISIDISSYQAGYYTIALICDSQVTDAKQLLKQ